MVNLTREWLIYRLGKFGEILFFEKGDRAGKWRGDRLDRKSI
ncbi:hypothetical protein QUA56_14375 [Microcoleus sp. N3A4]